MIETIPKVIIIFYIIAMAPFITNLISKQTKDFFIGNRYGYHAIGIMITIFLISYLGKTTNISDAIIYSSVAYGWFIMTTKLDLMWIMIMVIGIYLIIIYTINYNNKLENINEDEKYKLKKKYNKKITILLWGIFSLTLVGTFFYMKKQYLQREITGGFNGFDYFIN